MTKGLKYWTEEKRYCDQSNNVIEKARRDVTAVGYLESCSVESIYTGQDCMGDIEKFGNPKWMGIDCTPAHFMFGHLNWTKYDKTYSTGKAMDNRSIYNLQKMLRKMGYNTERTSNPTDQFFKRMLPNNRAVVINIPGHYCCAIAWDYLTGELIFHNPWPKDKRNKNHGRHERMKLVNHEFSVSQALAFWR